MRTYTIIEMMQNPELMISEKDMHAIWALHNAGIKHHLFQNGMYLGSLYSFEDARTWLYGQQEANPELDTNFYTSTVGLDGMTFYAYLQ